MLATKNLIHLGAAQVVGIISEPPGEIENTINPTRQIVRMYSPLKPTSYGRKNIDHLS
ncbi:MAG: hypothetical protein ACYCQI_04085 [Gammaproteobacteria bacterium]